jgi:hypothetical protein
MRTPDADSQFAGLLHEKLKYIKTAISRNALSAAAALTSITAAGGWSLFPLVLDFPVLRKMADCAGAESRSQAIIVGLRLVFTQVSNVRSQISDI